MTASCSACGKPLKDPVSIALGIGPKCWLKQFGSSAPRTTAGAAPTPAHAEDPDQIPLPLETTVDAETRKAAIDTIARHALHRCIEQTADAGIGRIDWGDYPELPEDVWNAVVDRIDAIAASIAPTADAYTAACEHLGTAAT